VRALPLVWLAALLAPLLLSAQDSLRISGHVGLRTARGERPVPSARVTLHAIGSRQAGPVDSVLSDSRGRYAFRVAADSALTYLATVRYGGIAYFSRPARLGDEGAGGGEIVVFDTTSRPLPLRTRGRHLVLATPDPLGTRATIDIYEVENDTVLTRVVRDEDDAVFVVALPLGARNVRTGEGDFNMSAVRIASDHVAVTAAFPPGARQLVLAYDLPASAFPLTVLLRDATDVLEVLAEEEGTIVVGEGIESQGPVALEGRTFLRFLGRDMPKAGRVSITALGPSGDGTPARASWVVALAGLAALGGLLGLARPRHANPKARPRVEILAEAIAAVDRCLADESMARQHAALTVYRAALARERASLLAQVAQSS
jgi:hypothetical protein